MLTIILAIALLMLSLTIFIKSQSRKEKVFKGGQIYSIYQGKDEYYGK